MAKKINKNENNKSDTIAKIIGIIVGIVLVLGISYGLFKISLLGKKTNKITTGTLHLTIKEDKDENDPEDIKDYTYIDVKNAVPLTLEEGLNTTPYVFTIINDGNIDAKYKLSLEVSKFDNVLPGETVRYFIVREDNPAAENTFLLSEKEHHESINEDNKEVDLYVLDEGIINVEESFDYRLYIWLDYDNATIYNAMTKNFEAKIRIDGFQKNS